MPVAGLTLLLAWPQLDVHWENQPAHFWLVLATGLFTGALAFLTGEAAARRRDARVLRLSAAFVAASGFLGLHALATPGVLLAGKNAGFQVAAAVGLLIASPIAAWSAVEVDGPSLLGRRRVIYGALAAVMALWAAVSLATLPPLDEPIDDPGPLLLGIFAAGAVFYGLAALGYLRLYRRRSRPLLLAAVAAFVLLAEGMLAIGLGRNWHATWWEWHLLMLVAFGLVARSAWQEWQAEGSTAEIFSDLYAERTRSHREDVTILFADLQGFTSYSERTPHEEVKAMLDEYFAAAAPIVERHGGQVDKTIGDALMVVFRGPDHAVRAARVGLDFQDAASGLADAHPGWPRFRVGVNSGEVLLGVVELRGGRDFTVTGDAVNVAARLEGQARAGEVVIGEASYAALGFPAGVEELEPLMVKGKRDPVRAYVLRSLAPHGKEGDQRLEDEQREPER
ncbi:MAG TPA: adenylate/guanylate cyclase domain-containing protein [Gaiellaceae bacterium]